MLTRLISYLATNRYVSVSFKTWETVNQLKIQWWLQVCNYRATFANKAPREPSSPPKPNPRAKCHNLRLFLKTRLTPLSDRINSKVPPQTTKLRKVSNTREEARTVSVINQLPIKRHRAQLCTPTAPPHHRKEWLATVGEGRLHLHSRGCRDSGFHQ